MYLDGGILLIGYLIKKIYLHSQCELNQQFAKFDLTASQTFVMIHLFQHHAKGILLNQKDLEIAFHLSNPTITGILQRLEAKGLIERKIGEKDARVKYISLTEKAHLLDEELKHVFSQHEIKLIQDLTTEEAQLLKQLLQRLLQQWEREGDDIV